LGFVRFVMRCVRLIHQKSRRQKEYGIPLPYKYRTTHTGDRTEECEQSDFWVNGNQNLDRSEGAAQPKRRER
jgi:hypothetical protein